MAGTKAKKEEMPDLRASHLRREFFR